MFLNQNIEAMNIRKIPIVTIILFSLFSASSYAQKENSEEVKVSVLKIPLSPNNDNAKGKLQVEGGAPVIVKFTGLNPLKYRYALNHSFVNLYSENKVSLSDIYSNSIATKERLGEGEDVTNDTEDMIKTLEEQEEIKIKEMANDSLAIQGSKNKSNKNLLMQKQFETQKEIEEIQKKIDSLKVIQNGNQLFFKGFFDQYPEELIALNISGLPGDSELKNAKNAYKLIEKNTEKLIKSQELIISAAKSKDQLDLETLQTKVKAVYDLNGINYSSFKELQKKFPFQNDAPIQETKKKILSNFKKIEETLNLVYSIQDSFGTAPIDHLGENIDYIKVTVDIVPIEDSTNAINRIQKYDYKVWVKGGVKIDFSAGLFMSSLMDRSYLAIQEEPSEGEEGDLYRISKEDNGKFEFGMGSTINFTSRGASSVRLGGSVGGFVTSNQKFRLVAGPTFTIGKMERLIFGSGVVMGEIESLSNRVNLTDVFDLGESGAVPTVQKFKTGYYFSFTYNLGKPKAKD